MFVEIILKTKNLVSNVYRNYIKNKEFGIQCKEKVYLKKESGIQFK